MKKNTSKYLLILFLLSGVIFFGCLDEIDFDVPAENLDSLVIQGRLVKGNPHVISFDVKRLFDFTGGSSFIRVDYVRVTNDQGQTIDLPNLSLGIYESEVAVNDPDFSIETGGSFTVEVKTLDGRTYNSTPETLYPVSKIENITPEIIQLEVPTTLGTEIVDGIRFRLNTPLTIPGEQDKARINWQLTRTFKITDDPIVFGVDPKTCYVTNSVDIENVRPFDGNTLGVDNLTDHPLYEAPVTFHYQQGLYLNVFQQSLSRGAFEYWDQIGKLLERNGNMFESPVGEIISNFENVDTPNEDIFGYFYATEIDTMHVFVDSTFVNSPGIYCPPPLPPAAAGECVAICCDCLDVQNSTLTIPDFWE